jgi:indoleamine 2,3-dioxygenase
MFPPAANSNLEGLINSMHAANTPAPPRTMALTIPPTHFLDLPHHVPDGPALNGIVPDTSTVAAHDFDIDVNTGFMPDHAPLTRIPLEVSVELQAWERVLDEGLALGMKLGDQLPMYGPEETEKNERWRASVRAVSRHHPSFGASC